MQTYPLWLFAAVWLLAAAAAPARDGPQFRGLHAGGVGDSRPLPTSWNVATGDNIRWKTPIPGLAHASPIVWGDRVYVAKNALEETCLSTPAVSEGALLSRTREMVVAVGSKSQGKCA